MADLRASWVGTTTSARTVRVAARDLANFAAGVQSRRRAYYDDTAPGGICSFPTFSSRLSWRAVKDLWSTLIALGCSPEVMERQVHYRTEIRNFRHFRPGEEVQVTTRVTRMTRHRAGTLMATEVSIQGADGKPICEESVEGMLRGVSCDAPADPLSAEPPSEPAGTGPEISLRFDVPMLLPYQYDGCADIHFPIHSSPAYARKAGLPGIIVQGSATLALCVDRICDWIAPTDAPVTAPIVRAKYAGYLLPGEEVILTARANRNATSRAEMSFALRTAEGREILKEGSLALAW